ncbi:MAG TPA: putative sulfate exporter family transporter [Stenomitos sp.]
MVEASPAIRKLGILPGIALALLLALASYLLAALPYLKVVGPLTVALLVGIGWRMAAGYPEAIVPGSKFTAKAILRLGVLLMGARLDFRLIAQVGPKIVLLEVVIITVGLIGISWIARRFGVGAKLAMLLAVGTSICGASAVAAAAPVTKGHEDDVSLAVAMCGFLGTLGVIFYVLVGPALGLTLPQLAIMSGSSLHEVAQVMAVGFTWGVKTGNLSTLVKLTRVVLLAPALLVMGFTQGGGALTFSWKEPPIPYFVLGFLALGAVASTGVIPTPVIAGLSNASIFLMVMAMAAMGLNTQMELVRKAGLKVVYAGLLGFFLLAGTSWSLIHLLHIS